MAKELTTQDKDLVEIIKGGHLKTEEKTGRYFYGVSTKTRRSGNYYVSEAKVKRLKKYIKDNE